MIITARVESGPAWILLCLLVGAWNHSAGQVVNASLGNRDILLNQANVPIYPWFPDGHISILADSATGREVMYWSEFENFRTTGDYVWPEFQRTLAPAEPVFGGRRDIERWDNGGSWLMSVFRQAGDSLVAFYHAEDHWDRNMNPGGIAWKSIARTVSADDGVNWSEGEQIITSNMPRPATPTWGGNGDHCVVWDSLNSRWVCYYQEHWLMMAISQDAEGRPGTWYKFYNGQFNEPGLGGRNTPIPGLQSIPGGNPSVHFNTYLDRYVMVWHSWQSLSIYFSTSSNGIDWDPPRILEPASGVRRAWYPTIIGDSDTRAGKVARLYYADIAGGFASRDFVSRAIVFDRDDEHMPQAAWQRQRLGAVPVLGLMDVATDNTFRMVSFSGSMDTLENVEYYYKDREGPYVVSGRFHLDTAYGRGPVGLSVRSGLPEGEAMAAILFQGDSLLFRTREIAGEPQLTRGTSVAWTPDTVWLQAEKTATRVTCRYSMDGETWTDLGSMPLGVESSKVGLFCAGDPAMATVAYVAFPESTSARDRSRARPGAAFQNPARDQLRLMNPEDYSHFALFDLSGKLQLNGCIEAGQVDVRALVPGMYVCHLWRKDQAMPVIGKLIIAR